MKKNLLNSLALASIVATLIAGLPLKAKAVSPGSLDLSFSEDGKFVHDFSGNGGGSGCDAVIQPDGKILAVGGGYTAEFAILRFLPNGSLDTTFDTDGIALINFGAQGSAWAVALQPDGKIVVIGDSGFGGSSYDFAVARLNPNGSLDLTFSGDGKVTTDFGAREDYAQSVVIQADGKTVVGGSATVGGNRDFALVRYNIDGSLDTTFSGDGKANFDLGGAENVAQDIKLQPDGRIVGAGTSGLAYDSSDDFAIFRVTTNGTLDTSFDTDGIATTDFGGIDRAYSVALLPDGKILAGGESSSFGVPKDSALARYNPDGSLDTTFDGDGKFKINLYSPTDYIFDIKLQIDGKIVAAVFIAPNIGGPIGLGAARFNANGGLDPFFGNGGFVVGSAGVPYQFPRAVAISGDKLIVVGEAYGIAVFQFNLSVKPSQSSDFDGDGFPDSAVFRPSTGTFYILNSRDLTVRVVAYGTAGDLPVDGDFDGDGKTDVGIYRASTGEWWISRSSAGQMVVSFGLSADKPVAGDYDKDGRSDVAVWRPSNGNYYVLKSSSNFEGFSIHHFGANGDLPVGAAIAP